MGDPHAFAVRSATQQDQDALVQLWLEVMEERAVMDVRVRLAEDAQAHWGRQLQAWITAPRAEILVADKASKLIGYAIALIEERPLYYYQQRVGVIVDMGVDGHAHQGGVGTALLENIKPWFKSQGVDLIEAPIMQLHPMAQAFWRAKGAVEVMTTFWYRLK
jgi:GNAT superfamily N-acetyltransferase